MSAFSDIRAALRDSPRKWLVTGAAGFIGSHLAEELLRLGQSVVALDNFATGKRANLENVEAGLPAEDWARFSFIEGDLSDPDTCRRACAGVDLVLHQAALGSVPRSIDDPLASHEANVSGTLKLLIAARDAGVTRFVYASSSSIYGDEPTLPRREELLGRVYSPYAATKLMTEIYAGVFARTWNLEPVGLRYFNVFGARQNPDGAYAAVIPKWVSSMIRGEPIFINGDGESSRDFCYIANVVQMNLLAALTERKEALDQAYNVAVHDQTSLNELFEKLKKLVEERKPGLEIPPPVYREFRPGDVRHSLADISKARDLLGYRPTHMIDDGLGAAIEWYCANLA